MTTSTLPMPSTVRHVVFSDFDETYLAHTPTVLQRAELVELEEFLMTNAERYGLLFGWVTGSSLSAVRRRMASSGARVLPHFIASSLGTELTFFDDGAAQPDEHWRQLLRASRFSKQAVAGILALLDRDGVVLKPQNNQNANEFLDNYYLASSGDQDVDTRVINRIRQLADENELGLNVNRCNPAAGDPADHYDVDFLPSICGKHNIVGRIRDRFGIDPENTFAFGDSGNDIEMLKAVRHGYLVANCTPEASGNFDRVSTLSYAAAILAVLQDRLTD